MDFRKIKKAIQNISQEDDRPKDSFTSLELAEALGVGHACAGKKISAMVRSGEFEFAGKITTTNIVGVSVKTPAYRMVK